MVPSRTHPKLKLIILEEHDEARMRLLRDEEDTTPAPTATLCSF